MWRFHRYVPNNGWGPDHFERRRKWDEAMKSFMIRKKEAGVKVMWIGDLVSRRFLAVVLEATTHFVLST